MKRTALFVGVNSYDDRNIRNLRYSIPDASVLADRFSRLGYETRLLSDPTAAELKASVEDLSAGLEAGDVFLFFFSGHGFTAQDGAHLLFCRDDKQRLLSVNSAGTRVEALAELASGPFHRAILLDSCRSDALAGIEEKGNGSKDLDFVPIPKSDGSTFVLRSCNRRLPSLEIESLGHGLFTQGLLDALDDRIPSLLRCGTELAEGVGERMAKRAAACGVVTSQRPSSVMEGPSFSLFDEAFLVPSGGAAPAPSGPGIEEGVRNVRNWIARLEGDERFASCLASGDGGFDGWRRRLSSGKRSVVRDALLFFGDGRFDPEGNRAWPEESDPVAVEILEALCEAERVSELERTVERLNREVRYLSDRPPAPGRGHEAVLARETVQAVHALCQAVGAGVERVDRAVDRLRGLREADWESDALDALRDLADAMRDDFAGLNVRRAGQERKALRPRFFSSSPRLVEQLRQALRAVPEEGGKVRDAIRLLFRLEHAFCDNPAS